jgi:hypothetical protein
MVDLVRQHVGIDRPVTLDDRRPVLGRGRRDLLAAGAERVAAENDRQPSDRPILRVLYAFVPGMRGELPTARQASRS